MPRTARALATTFLFALLAVSSSLLAQTAADLSVTKVDDPDPVAAGSSLVYTITVSNKGPDSAGNATLDDPLPAGTSFQSLAAPAGWSCAAPAVGAGGTVSCSSASFAVGSVVFTLTVGVDAGTANGTVLSNTVTVASASADPNPGAETAGADTMVVASTAAVAITKTASPDPVLAGASLTYTLTASNNGGAELESATVADTLPASTTFVSLASPAGWNCTTPPAGGTGTVSCDVSPFTPGSAVFTLVVQVDSQVPGGTDLANQALLTVTDGGRTTTQTAEATTGVQGGSVPPPVPTLGEVGLIVLALLLAMGGAVMLRRRRASSIRTTHR
ncbi:MAG: IPTL-CTERM sorting domain-containing protein [Thermoanaerobaculia bacterium]